MDGYLRLSQRKNAGTPITAAQLEGAARPADERNLRNKLERGLEHRHFLPRVRQRQEVMSRQRRRGNREGDSNGPRLFATGLGGARRERTRCQRPGFGGVACGERYGVRRLVLLLFVVPSPEPEVELIFAHSPLGSLLPRSRAH